MLILTFLLLLCSGFAQANSQLYVLGETYITHFESGKKMSVIEDIDPKSWAMDPKSCHLWVTSQNESKLYAFERGIKFFETSFNGRIVSDFSPDYFATANESGTLEIRNSAGTITAQHPFENIAALKQTRFQSQGGSWNLFVAKSPNGEDMLWLNQTDQTGKEIRKVMIEKSENLWGNALLLLDEIRQRIWLGYSRGTPQHMYSPRVVQFSTQGELIFSNQWNERGLFFDGCLEKNGDFLISRDVPSGSFTVPVYSYLENVVAGLLPLLRLELNTNLLVDSMACLSDSVYLGVHSILGGEPHQVLKWNRNSKNSVEPIVTVPPKIQKIYICESETI